MAHLLINAGLFQITWFAAVLGGTGPAWLACGLLAGHVGLRDRVRADVVLAGIAAVVGFCLDTLWIRTGVLDYGGAAWAPAWIVALWVAVGLSLNHSLAFCVRQPRLGAGLVALSCPLSYSGGAAFGAVAIPEPALLVVVALVWAGVFWALFAVVAPAVGRRFDVTATSRTPAPAPR